MIYNYQSFKIQNFMTINCHTTVKPFNRIRLKCLVFHIFFVTKHETRHAKFVFGQAHCLSFFFLLLPRPTKTLACHEKYTKEIVLYKRTFIPFVDKSRKGQPWQPNVFFNSKEENLWIFNVFRCLFVYFYQRLFIKRF